MPSVKFDVDVSSFKNGISSAKSEVKTLDQQMKMIDATFKATGDSEQALAQKTQTLNSRMTAQKSIADQAKKALDEMTKKGIDPSSESYQRMARELLAAQTGMMDTQAALNDLSEGTLKAADSAGRLEDGLNGISKKISLEQVINGVGKITDGMEKAAKNAVKLGKAVASEVLGAGSWADELATTAKAYGISTDELQRMQKTSQIIDTDVDTILQARQKLAKNSGNLMELLGFSADGMSIEDAFWETGKAIMSMGDAMKQEEVAQKIFGKGWRELVPLFDAGREEYERINDTWSTVSDDQLKSLTEMDDKYQTLKADLETLKMEALSELAAPMGNLMQSLSDLMSSDEGKAAIDNVLGSLKDTLNWIAEHKSEVITALEALGVAFAGLKVSETVLTFVKLAQGLSGLFGGGGATAAGAAAGGGGWIAKAAGMKTMLSAGGLSALTPLGVLGLGLAPAEIAMAQARQQWSADYNRRQSAANLNGENAWFIRQAAEALGKNGYDVNMNMAEELLMSLAARQNQQKAELYNTLRGSTTEGNDTWNLLNSFWAGATLDQHTIDEMLKNITEAFAARDEKAQIPVDVKVPEDAAALLEKDIGDLTIKANIVPFFGGLGNLTGEVEGHSHANGLRYVPTDNYLAILHKGERVVPAREVTQNNRNYSSNLYVEKMVMGSGLDAEGLAARMAAAQRREMNSLGS